MPKTLTAKVNKAQTMLTIEIPLDKDGTPSSTGKTMVHASTRGNHEIEGVVLRDQNLVLGVNAYTYKVKK